MSEVNPTMIEITEEIRLRLEKLQGWNFFQPGLMYELTPPFENYRFILLKKEFGRAVYSPFLTETAWLTMLVVEEGKPRITIKGFELDSKVARDPGKVYRKVKRR